MSQPVLNVLLGATLCLGMQAVLAQDQKAAARTPAVESFHAQCTGCHGIPGYKTAFPSVYHVPKIAGQQPGYIAAALKAYRSGDRSHPSMRGIAASLTDERIEELARFYGAPAQ
jgi:cytochrome c553